MNLRFSDLAESDLDKIYRYVAQHDPQAAVRLVDKIIQSLKHLESFPLMGKPGRKPDTRELVIPRTPYFAVYTLPDAIHVDVERIIHGARDYPWL